MNVKFFKPILPKKQELSLTANVLEQSINNHPIILFVDEFNDLWYLKCRSANLRHSNQLKRPFKGEILIHKNKNNNQLFWNDTYVDTSHIFKINNNDFDYLTSKYSNDFIYADDLSDDNIDRIYDNIIANIIEVPPNINMIKVNVDKNNDDISFYTEYANQTTFDLEFNNYMKNYGNTPEYASTTNHVKQLKEEIGFRNSTFEKLWKGICSYISNNHLDIIKARLYHQNKDPNMSM